MFCNYNNRYWKLYNRIKGFLEELVVVSYMLELTPDKKFYDNLKCMLG